MDYLIKRKKLFSLILIALFLLSFTATTVYAEFDGGKWNKRPVYWKKTTGLVDGSTNWSSLIRWGAQNWNGIAEFSYSESPGDNYIDVTVEGYYYGDPYNYGLGIPYPNHGPIYESGEIYLNTYALNLLSEKDKIKAITHEFGHVLGLAHTEDFIPPISSIMDPGDVFDSDVEGPTEYDKGNLRTLYP